MSYETQIGEFLDACLDGGKTGARFDADVVERLADEHDVTVDDGAFRQARDKWRYGQTQQFAWTRRDARTLVAGATTSGGTNVLLTFTMSGRMAGVLVEEVTRDGRPWRVLGEFSNINAAIDARGLTAPKQVDA